MSNPLVKYGVDREAERQGTIIAIDDMTFTVRSTSSSNRAYRYALAVAAAKYREQFTNTNPAQAFEVHESVLIEAFANSVITGWDNVEGAGGSLLEFNPQNCVMIMESCPAIWDKIREEALKDSRFKLNLEADGELLGKSLSGTLDTAQT